jgi:hypothetical protein
VGTDEGQLKKCRAVRPIKIGRKTTQHKVTMDELKLRVKTSLATFA